MKKNPLLGTVAAVALVASPVSGTASPLQAAPQGRTPIDAPARTMTCDDSMKAAFRPDHETQVMLVRAFRAGERLNLDGKPSGPVAAHDVCLVKLNVGPGNPGPANA